MLRKRFYRLVGYHFFLNFARKKRSKENLELNREEFRCDTHKKTILVGSYQGERRNLFWKQIRV